MASTGVAAPVGSIRKLIVVSLAVMSGAFVFGIEAGTLTGFQAMEAFLKDFGYFDTTTKSWNLRTPVQSAIASLLLVGAVLGAVVAGPIGTRYGRRPGLLTLGSCAILGVILQISYPSLALLLIGRLFSGAAIGLASNFVPVYLSEVAPTRFRGVMISLYQLGINVGGLIGVCINQGTHAMSTRWAYRIPLLVGLIFPSTLMLATLYLPETPRWLLSVDRNEDAARSIRRLRGDKYPESQLQADINDIATHIALERQFENSTSYLDLFKGTDLRRTHITCGVLLFQIFSGITFISAYGAYFFEVSGITNVFLVTVISTICQLVGIFVMYPSMHFMGRRTILLIGAVCESFCMFAFAVIATAAPESRAANKCVVAFVCLFGFFFTWSWGPVAWVVASEVSSNTLRSRTQSVGTSLNWIVSLIVTIVIPYLINPAAANLGPKASHCIYPTDMESTNNGAVETGGRSLEELDELFLNRVPTRKFKSYVCRGHVEHELNGEMVSIDIKEKAGEASVHVEQRP